MNFKIIYDLDKILTQIVSAEKMLIMKIFLSVLILIVSFQSLVKADDIRDFEIEGISIGGSLLSFGSEDQINSIKSSQQYKSKYTIYDIEKLIQIDIYDYMSATTKKDDKNFIVTSVAGIINYTKLDKCLEKQKKIVNEIEGLLKYDEKKESVYPSQRDKTGNSKIDSIIYYFKPHPSNEAITIDCKHFTNESNIQRTLSVSVKSDDFADYIINEAYK